MKITKNKFYSKSKFFNIKYGKNKWIFTIFPTIFIIKEKNIDWTIAVKTVFFCYFNYSFQFNFFKIRKNTDLKINKKEMVDLLAVLKKDGLEIDSNNSDAINNIVVFFNENFYLVNLWKNSSLSNPYVVKLLKSFLVENNLVV